MKRIITVLIITILVLGFILSIGCAKSETEPYRIDREITGQVLSIDNQGTYSILYFGNNLKCEITNSSLDHWLIRNMFKNVWTYKLRETTIIRNRYDLIGINDEVLD